MYYIIAIRTSVVASSFHNKIHTFKTHMKKKIPKNNRCKTAPSKHRFIALFQHICVPPHQTSFTAVWIIRIVNIRAVVVEVLLFSYLPCQNIVARRQKSLITWKSVREVRCSIIKSPHPYPTKNIFFKRIIYIESC